MALRRRFSKAEGIYEFVFTHARDHQTKTNSLGSQRAPVSSGLSTTEVRWTCFGLRVLGGALLGRHLALLVMSPDHRY